jgi:(p)ppGpp synthase/HD superfamily hydrolase
MIQVHERSERRNMRKLKDMPYADLLQAIRLHPGCSESLLAAIALTTYLHAGQTRKDPVQGRVKTAYVEHCLRGVLRLMRLDVTDEATLIASSFHDTVEDCPEVFAPQADSVEGARLALRSHIETHWGETVAATVDGVTNPYEPREAREAMSDADKHAAYQAKVGAEIASSVRVFLVKFSDYVDNAGSLHHTPEEHAPRARRLAAKYEPLVEVFRQTGRAWAAKYPHMANWDEIDAILVRIGDRLRAILAG